MRLPRLIPPVLFRKFQKASFVPNLIKYARICSPQTKEPISPAQLLLGQYCCRTRSDGNRRCGRSAPNKQLKSLLFIMHRVDELNMYVFGEEQSSRKQTCLNCSSNDQLDARSLPPSSCSPPRSFSRLKRSKNCNRIFIPLFLFIPLFNCLIRTLL